MSAANDFGDAVEEGIKLAKRIYYGKDRSMAPPSLSMVRTSRSYLPPAPMVYAVVSDPGIVDNPDIPSYQPYVHGRCDPPALIPLQMNAVSLEADCYLDTVFVTFSGTWRVHCVMGSKSCDCRLAVPMGEQGSLLGVEVDIPRKSYKTQLVGGKDEEKEDKGSGVDGGFLTPNIVTLTIPQVDGGTNINIKISWSQKILYHEGDFSLTIPFSFPEYVTPAVKKIPKHEKIRLSVNYGDGNEILCKNCSHSLKEQKRQPGNLSFLHETDVLSWSSLDFTFSYNVPASHISGNVYLKSPSTDDVDQREMFTIQILPGSLQKEVLRRKVVYVVDVSGSMRGKPLEDTKSVLSTALSQLHPQDSFNIIAFNGGTFLYSSVLKQASKETIEEAKEWMEKNFVAGDGTNILLAVTQALEMLSESRDSIPMIFLVTDGSVADEKLICDTARSCLSNCKTVSPRIHTFGIGTFCNHYFLQMLAMIGRGYYDSAYDPDLIYPRFGKLFSRGASTIFSNVTVGALSNLDDLEVYPASIPDLSSESPLSISGRYGGNFPDVVKAEGVIVGMKKTVINLKVHRVKEIPIDKIVAMQQIATCTAQAWLSQDKMIEKKVAELSLLKGIVSEYILLSFVETEKPLDTTGKGGKKKLAPKKTVKKAEKQKEISRTIMVKSIGVGFGNLHATEENVPTGYNEEKPQQAAEIIVKAATSCCSQLCGMCCCMCCIQACNKVNNQCAIVLAQLCAAFACFGCLECCADLCCGGQD